MLPSEEGLDEFVDAAIQLDSVLEDNFIRSTGSVLDDWLEKVTALCSETHVTDLGAHEGAELIDEFGLGLVPEFEHVAAVEDLRHNFDHAGVDVTLLHDWLDILV